MSKNKLFDTLFLYHIVKQLGKKKKVKIEHLKGHYVYVSKPKKLEGEWKIDVLLAKLLNLKTILDIKVQKSKIFIVGYNTKNTLTVVLITNLDKNPKLEYIRLTASKKGRLTGYMYPNYFVS